MFTCKRCKTTHKTKDDLITHLEKAQPCESLDPPTPQKIKISLKNKSKSSSDEPSVFDDDFKFQFETDDGIKSYTLKEINTKITTMIAGVQGKKKLNESDQESMRKSILTYMLESHCVNLC